VPTLHYHPGSANMAPHILLHELGLPFELALVDRANNAHKSAAYLKLNPNGLMPVLIDGELVLYETAAICLHLADTHPQAQLAPPLGTAERAHFYKWLIWLTNTVQARLIHYFYAERLLDPGNSEGAAQIRAHAMAQVVGMLQQLDAQLAAHGGPWLLGAHYSAADALAFTVCRWTRGFTSRPAREFAHIGPYLQRMLARPAVRKMLAAEGLQPPFV
jgi:glutathione S-transferase